MTPELEALARRAVACPRWRWMPGMKVGNDRIMDESETREVRSDELPDLTDFATLGCLVALVREAWADLIVVSLGSGWFQVETGFKDWDQDNTTSFVHALVAALEVGP
jgi:hypothetical protein